MNIRKYQKGDHRALVDLWQTVFPDLPAHKAPSRMISDKLAVDDLIFVVEQEGELIGACMAGYDGHRGWLYGVGVVEQYRRNGVGARLVRHAVQSLGELGCAKVNLQILSSNTKVATFYKSLGFSVEDRLSMGAFTESIGDLA